MYQITLPWKSFKVHLPDMEIWLKSICGDNYAGNSADADFKIWFHSEHPTEEHKAMILSHWDALTEEGENTKIVHAQKLDRALAAAKQNLPYLEWNTMLPAERKLVMGQTLSADDHEALLTKYPQV